MSLSRIRGFEVRRRACPGRFLPALTVFVLGLACKSGTLPPEKTVGGEMLQLTAEVRKFIPQALHDNFGPQGFAVYDATELAVIEPADYQGRTIRIFHQPDLPADSPWRRIGQRLRMRLPKTMLEPGKQIFSGAVQDLQPQ
jgi:hypothetical protein